MRTVADKLIERAGRPGGASRYQLLRFVDRAQRPVARERLEDLLRCGSILRYTRPARGGRGQHARQYFTCAVEGQRWATAAARDIPAPKPKRPAYKAKALTVSDKRRREGVKLPPGPVNATVLQGDAMVIVPAGLTPTVLPSNLAFDARYQVDPAARVVGGFAAMGPGRYLDGGKA